MRNCHELSKLLSESIDRSLTWQEKVEIFFHIGICPSCRQFRKNTKNLHQLMQVYREREKQKK